MSEEIRVHVGNGSIYLLGWVNIDVYESGAGLAQDCPDRVKRWGTTEAEYYAKSKFASKAGMVDTSEFVVDAYGSWESMPFEEESVDQILSRQCFEHLSKREAQWAFLEAHRVLKPGGILRIDVPDHAEAMSQFAALSIDLFCTTDPTEKPAKQNKKDFMLRHILGSRKNDFAYHMGSWTREKMIAFAERRGFKFVEEETNIHFYPAFCLRFERAELTPGIDECNNSLWAAPWMFAGNPRGTPIQVPDDWQCLEVGPGDDRRKWPRADIYVDKCHDVLAGLNCSVLDAIQADICQIPDAFPDIVSGHDSKFDFVLCSHVLEHLDDPVGAGSAMAAIADSGCIIVPGPGIEALFWNHEPDHKWTIVLNGDTLYFHPKNPVPRDKGAESIMHKLLRLGAPQYGSEGAYMRRAFRNAEPYLDQILYWTGEPKIVVVK
jgi:predicted SAM-dependent methyltransferase